MAVSLSCICSSVTPALDISFFHSFGTLKICSRNLRVSLLLRHATTCGLSKEERRAACCVSCVSCVHQSRLRESSQCAIRA